MKEFSIVQIENLDLVELERTVCDVHAACFISRTPKKSGMKKFLSAFLSFSLVDMKQLRIFENSIFSHKRSAIEFHENML